VADNRQYFINRTRRLSIRAHLAARFCDAFSGKVSDER
jgi:hypothetical protein